VTSQSTQPGTTYKTSDPRTHYVELDGLRGIAILMTVITHIAAIWFIITQRALYIPLVGVDLIDLLFFGYLAVPLFFLLSGYLLTWTEEGRRRRGSYSILNYAKRRALRIVPAYYLAITVVILVTGLIGVDPPHPSIGVVVIHLVFLHGFAVSYPLGLDLAWWSLTPEIVFYAMLPLLVLKFQKFSQRAVILTILVVVSLVTRLLQAYDAFDLLPLFQSNALGQDRMHFFPTTYLYLFLVGMLLRMMVERRAQASHPPVHYQRFVVSALTIIALAVLLVFPYLVMSRNEILHSPATMIPEAMIILLFTSVLVGNPILKPLIRWSPLVFVGEISYSLFLLHGTLILAMLFYTRYTLRDFVANQSELIVWVTFAALVFVLLAVAGTTAYLSYRYIESPFLHYKPK
jgi:peptidoglycan/LPS O-acetylase OafA/YrhL